MTGWARSSPTPVNLLDAAAVQSAMDSVRPDLVIHAAAIADVDLCEREPVLAKAMHVTATANLVNSLDVGTRLVLVSTDQVYPDAPGPHREANVGPVNVYGRTKFEAELVALRHPRTVVARTNFFGESRTPGRHSLSDFIAERLHLGTGLTLFTDSFFSPLHLATVAGLLLRVGCSAPDGVVLNLGSREGTSKAEFGRMIGEHLGLDHTWVPRRATPGGDDRAPRPKDLRMAVDLIESMVGERMPTLLEEVARISRG